MAISIERTRRVHGRVNKERASINRASTTIQIQSAMSVAYHIVTSVDIGRFVLLQNEQVRRARNNLSRRIDGGRQRVNTNDSRHRSQRRTGDSNNIRGRNLRTPSITRNGDTNGDTEIEEINHTSDNSAEKTQTQTSTDEETTRNNETRRQTRSPSISSQTTALSDDGGMACAVGQNQYHYRRNQHSPWKVIAQHRGTSNDHYHIIYIGAKNWGHNSQLGETIRSRQYKCTQITCIQCLLEYITTGDDRTTLKQVLTERDKEMARCVAHSLGFNPEQMRNYYGNTERRNNIFPPESPTRGNEIRRMDQSPTRAHENIFQGGEIEQQFSEREDDYNGFRDQSNAFHDNQRINTASRRAQIIRENQRLVLYLCENQAFNEGEAIRILCTTPAGIAMQFNRNFEQRLKTALSVAKTLVFSECTKQRLERAKQYQLQQDPEANNHRTVYDGVEDLEILLTKNQLNPFTFSKVTKDHFYGKTGKKNNLFFYGPPSTGKTMIMESLVALHYNYCRLTGLTPTSPFNFASLLHTNACFMDECKLTDNQFEQWKLLAGRQPMSTDIKYKDRHDITNCILYTASNYPINAYLTIGDTYAAIESRTLQFNFYQPTDHFKLNAFIWEAFWKKYPLEVSEEDKMDD